MFEDPDGSAEHTPSICQICGLVAQDMDAGFILEMFKYESSPPEGVAKDWETLDAQLKWLSDLRLLCDPDDEFGQLLPDFTYEEMYSNYVDENDPDMPPPRPRSQASDIEIYPATPREGLSFDVEDPGTGRSWYATVFWALGKTSDERVYVVTHAACLEIAKMVLASSRIAHVRDMRGLFTALRWRQGIATKCVYTTNYREAARPKVNYTLADHNYYMPDCNWGFDECPGMEWPGPYGSARANLCYTLLRHPLEIEDLTNCLLRNLKPCRSEVTLSADSAKTAEGLARMPPEILDLIFLEMGRDLPRTSSHIISQKHWKEQLKAGNKGLLPWLWDIDADLVDQKDAERCPEGFEWDWELLHSEQERNPDEQDEETPWIWTTVGTGYHTDLAQVPAGLHNRRRIWQLVEEMFVGDAIPEPELRYSYLNGPSRARYELKKEWVLLWWDKSGALLPSPLWIPCINRFWPASKDGWHVGLCEAFGRRIGGEVFAKEGARPVQYWHAEKERDGATLEEVYAVLRPLGYPV